MPLKRLLSGLNASDSLPGDVTTDDWEPVPATAAALPEDTFDWLQGDPMPPEPVHPFLPPEEEGPPKPDHLQCFSAEELAIIEQQQAAAEEVEPEPEPLFRIPTGPPPPKTEAEPPSRELVEHKSELPPPEPPQPRKRVVSERGRWVEVVKNVGEHLSELELKIIRKQLASS